MSRYLLTSSIGDFSFSLALLNHHRCKNITATSYDSKDELFNKYPKMESTLDLLQGKRDVINDVDAAPDGDSNHSGPPDDEEEWEGFSSSSSNIPENGVDHLEPPPSDLADGVSTMAVLHSIDARKLSSSKDVRKRGPYDKVVFNFPHVGGISKDVNRQVRLNQELLVGFFKACKGILASSRNPTRKQRKSDYYDTDDEGEEEAHQLESSSNGQVLLTVFEGEPYTLWNVRDLGRHSGYRVIESFRFPWEAYPGYHHARTIGDIQGKEREDGKRSGAWRGEEREARMYVFELNDAQEGGTSRNSPGSKRKKGSDSEDSD